MLPHTMNEYDKVLTHEAMLIAHKEEKYLTSRNNPYIEMRTSTLDGIKCLEMKWRRSTKTTRGKEIIKVNEHNNLKFISLKSFKDNFRRISKFEVELIIYDN
jgi:hypothetical protein